MSSLCNLFVKLFFFCKQKTAYELRISDWSSDVCSSDLLYDHLMRATPDRPIFGEISTQNAFAALAVLNAGMTGFMCSIHADSPEQAINRKFDQNIAWSGSVMPKVPEYLCELVVVVVQIKRYRDGWRRITDIYEPKLDRRSEDHTSELQSLMSNS